MIGAYRIAKHFCYRITMNFFTFERNQDSIEAEALLDGIYVIRTSACGEALGPERAVLRSYKDLSDVEQVRTLIFLYMLSRYVRCPMEEALAHCCVALTRPQSWRRAALASWPRLDVQRLVRGRCGQRGRPICSRSPEDVLEAHLERPDSAAQNDQAHHRQSYGVPTGMSKVVSCG